MTAISPITRLSSRRAPLDRFLADLLQGATGYDRIAGYFSSSILEVAGEALDAMPDGTACGSSANSDLDPLDVLSARAAKQAMTREWKRSLPEEIPPPLRERLERLAGFLASGRLQVRVLPDTTLRSHPWQGRGNPAAGAIADRLHGQRQRVARGLDSSTTRSSGPTKVPRRRLGAGRVRRAVERTRTPWSWPRRSFRTWSG